MANKHTKITRLSRALGQPCAYCWRSMTFTVPGRRPTRDHIHPKSQGGRMTVWACESCNNMKGDMTQDQWSKFMASNPRWWNIRSRFDFRYPTETRESAAGVTSFPVKAEDIELRKMIDGAVETRRRVG